MNYERAKEYLDEIGQLQLLKYYEELSEAEKLRLLKDIESADFSVLQNIGSKPRPLGKITPVEAVTVADAKICFKEFEAAGLELLKNGKVAAVLLAGGQGSRLGYDGPKGTYDMGESRSVSIFALQMKEVLSVAERAGRHFHLFIMTGAQNNEVTVKFFKDNNYFGYPCEYVHFYVQDVAPTCDLYGKVFLDEKHRVSLASNGNGGWYSSLVNGGLKTVLEKEKIEWLNVYSVDNVLQKMCDPAFIGATVLKGCGCGAKVVSKTCPEEKVGVLCNEDGNPTVLEYFEMPENLKTERVDGELLYRYGVTLNYLFNVNKLDGTFSGKLPYHLAKKAIAHVENGERITPEKPCGYKFETLVVDMVKMMGSCLAYEVEREKEFAPVKNLHGVDSVDTARVLLKSNGIEL
jgi:UDP-N-acetylglucosamine/UDP-N-acetylgalactosamine diphosphorylase